MSDKIRTFIVSMKLVPQIMIFSERTKGLEGSTQSNAVISKRKIQEILNTGSRIALVSVS
jgi:hypothetical protein